MLDIAQSSVIMWQTLQHVGGRRKSQDHSDRGEFLKTNRNSPLGLCACLRRENEGKG